MNRDHGMTVQKCYDLCPKKSDSKEPHNNHKTLRGTKIDININWKLFNLLKQYTSRLQEKAFFRQIFDNAY